MSPRRPNRPSGPFPYLDEPEYRAQFVEAGLADHRCTLDRSALERMATEAINLKPLIATSGNKKTGVVVTGFKDAAVDPVPTEHGTLYQLRVKQPGLASAINQFNIRFAYDVAQNATVPTPRVVPVKTPDGGQQAVLEVDFASEEALLEHLTFVEGRLTAAEKARKYDLKADLAVSGQSERATYHVVRYRVGDQVWVTTGATAGSNRTRHRHDLFGLQPAVGLLGLPQQVLGGPASQRWRNPADWRDRYTTQLNTYAGIDPEDIEIPLDDPEKAKEAQENRRWAQLAASALQVATTDAAFIIGYVPAEGTRPDFDAALASTNLRTHLRGPLDFTGTNQAMASGRKLVDRAYADDAITELEHAVLTGATPAAYLHGDPREAVMRLVRLVDRVVFPRDIPSLRRTTKTLVEPSPSLLRAKHAQTRGEIRSALLTASVGGVDLPAAAMDTPHQKMVRQGIPTTGLSAAELIAAATSTKPSDGRDAARTELAHVAVPGLVNGKVLLGSYGSTGDRRAVSTKLAAARITYDGVRLFVEAIDAFAEVMQLRAGREVMPRPGASAGRLRRVADGAVVTTDATKPADSEWFTSHWPVENDDSGGGAGTPSELSPSEQWAEKLKDTTGLVENAKKAVTALTKHFEAMHSLVGSGREMTADERQDWQDELDKVESNVQEAGKHLRKLRYRPTDTDATTGGIDDFTFGTEQAE
ncbi:hypothetical protein EQK42_00175 [Streptomyces albidoflavus]|uniref:hypothetical protein n=1 Tax=Streptomyces albidoflavus TaxID=1886 RepID=UPI000FF067E8|nr:hypothetical protein [Streptomyces albidoflavus]RWZ77980.1 hypothetical protein EQK42_00175 [Streptomyces albidoflavus]